MLRDVLKRKVACSANGGKGLFLCFAQFGDQVLAKFRDTAPLRGIYYFTPGTKYPKRSYMDDDPMSQVPVL